ncbi:hypothetical protein [Serratia grimesii]|uniref:hypothetical protein n=1 Tax=Serratia grimesii TaxID=82995 RepID=UPI0039AFEAEA
MHIPPSDCYRESIIKAVELSQSSNRADKLVAIIALSFNPGGGVSRTAEANISRLTNDADAGVAEFARYVLSNTLMMPKG